MTQAYHTKFKTQKNEMRKCLSQTLPPPEGSLTVCPPEQGLLTLRDLWGAFRRSVDLDGKKIIF